MTLVLELPSELEQDLAARAKELQLPLADYAVRVLAGADVTALRKAASGAEVVAFWEAEGLVGTKSQIVDPAEHARSLRQAVEQRMR